MPHEIMPEMGGAAGRAFYEYSGRFDPLAPPANGPILTGARPRDLSTSLEPGYKPYPFGVIADVVGVPAVSPTAVVGSAPWDSTFGHKGPLLPNQVGIEGAQPLPIGPQPTTGF